MVISTREPGELPGVGELRELARSLAVLDAILCAEWAYRYYSFDAEWGPEQSMGSMRDGSGDHWFALFMPAGGGIIGLAHEAPIYEHGKPPAGLFEGLPPELEELRTEPAFDAANSTFCLWRLNGGDRWHRGTVELPEDHPDPDGSAELLAILDGEPSTYVAFASDYYEHDIDLEAARAIYAAQPLSDALLRGLDPDADLDRIRAEAEAMSYPVR